MLVAVPIVLISAAALGGPVAAQAYAPPSPGAVEIGDPLFPGLGNGGYDALHYDLALTS